MIPSMVSLPERVMLRDFVGLNYEGVGELVEIGTFCGSSAIAILQGIHRNGNFKKLHIFDTFLFPTNDLEKTYRKFLPRVMGNSFRSEFDFQTRAWKEWLIVTEGDASAQKWTGGPIEFMHVDCSVSREFHRAIAVEFYPHILESAVIAHQDFTYARAPFIKEIMESLSLWFKPIWRVETTQYFRCLKTITRDEIERLLVLKAAA
jgi:hypothetical protein